jgi:hypothetical protein
MIEGATGDETVRKLSPHMAIGREPVHVRQVATGEGTPSQVVAANAIQAATLETT